MDTVKTVKEKLEIKLKELEEVKKKIPKKCGDTVSNTPVSLAIKIEELEEEIEDLKDKLKCSEGRDFYGGCC